MHVITGLDVGGAEGQLARLLLDGGRFADGAAVVSLTTGGAWAERLRAAGVPVVSLGMARFGLGGLAELVRLIRFERPKVVQAWMYHANLAATVALMLAGDRRKTRLLWGVRASDLDLARYGRSLRFVVRLGALLSRLPDAIVANSFAAEAAHQRLGYRARRWLVVPNGVDTRHFRPDAAARAAVRAELGIPPDAPVVVHVARVDPMKDHGMFLAALDRLDVHALAVGLGTDALPARPGLHRLGRRDDVARLLAAADVFVSSSAFGEGFSNALAEAMATGVVPVVTDVGDARRIVGDTGVVVPPGDAAALSRAIAGVLDDPGRAARGLAARARAMREFTLDNAAAGFLAAQSGP